MAPLGGISFSASGGSGAGYAWSLSTNGSGGLITSAGLYTAGATGSATDIVRLVDSLGNGTTSTVTVTVAVAVQPSTLSLAPMASQTFVASGGRGAYAWSLSTNGSGGAINGSTGAYVVGSLGGTQDVVEVTDANGATARRGSRSDRA